VDCIGIYYIIPGKVPVYLTVQASMKGVLFVKSHLGVRGEEGDIPLPGDLMSRREMSAGGERGLPSLFSRDVSVF